MNKSIIAIVILLLACLALVFVYSIDEPSDSANKTELVVYSEGSIPLSVILNDIENYSYYDGYDRETLDWMKSLGDKDVFKGNGTIVVMSSADSGKLNSTYVTDAYIEETIKCNILENRSLGDIEYPCDVLLIEDVEYIGEEVHFYDV